MNFQRGSAQPNPEIMETVVRYFLITVMLKDKSVHKGIRESEYNDADSMFIICRNKAFENYGRDNVIYFQSVQLSKHSDEVMEYLRKKSAGNKTRRI